MDRAYVYGVIADCSAPYYVKDCNKYLCTVKLIDDTVNPSNATSKKPAYLNTTIFANQQNELPTTTKISSILRIHRGETKKYAGGYQFNCDVNIKAAWALFDPVESNTAISHTGRHYTFVDDDKVRLKDIRSFIKKHFRDYDPTDVSGIGDKKDEIDLLGVLLERKAKDAGIDRLLLCDGKEIYKIEVPRNKYDYVSPQDVLRARGILVSRKGKISKYTVSEFSNLIKIPKEYKAAADLSTKINKLEEKNELKKEINLYSPPKAGQKIVVSTVMEKSLKASKLKDLFAPDADKKADKRFRVKVSVIEIGPKSPKDWICTSDTTLKKK